ncbi:hypothetical protein ACOSQ3_023380 [Xanthoceras sorbifolium]
MQGRRSQEGEILPLNDRIDRIRRVTDSTAEPTYTSDAELFDVAIDDRERVQPHNQPKVLVQIVMRDFTLPIIEISPSCILLDDLSRNYELKNIHFNMLPAFHSIAAEDPLTFMRKFYSTIHSFPLQRLSEEQLKIKFIRKFYSHQKTIEMQRKITNFAWGDVEPFHEAWDRFKVLIIQRPHHGFPLELQNKFFYDGLNMNCQVMVDNAAGGAMQEKTMDEVYELFEMLGANSQQKSVRGKTQGVHEVHTNAGLVKQIYDVMSKLNVNLPLLEMIKKMPAYVKFFRELNKRKKQYGSNERVMISETVSAVLQHKLPPKLKDPGSFNIDITVGNVKKKISMLDLGASINLMPYSVYMQLGLNELKPTSMSLLLANQSTRYPRGIVEDIFIQVDKLIVPADFVVLDMDDARTTETDLLILLGRPFITTVQTMYKMGSYS